MNISTLFGGGLAVIMAVAIAAIVGILIVYRTQHKKLSDSTKYLLTLLKILEADSKRLGDDFFVLKESLLRKGLLDEDEFELLKRQIIEIPRQREAETNELIKGKLEQGQNERLIKDVPDIYH